MYGVCMALARVGINWESATAIRERRRQRQRRGLSGHIHQPGEILRPRDVFQINLALRLGGLMETNRTRQPKRHRQIKLTMVLMVSKVC